MEQNKYVLRYHCAVQCYVEQILDMKQFDKGVILGVITTVFDRGAQVLGMARHNNMQGVQASLKTLKEESTQELRSFNNLDKPP